MGYDAKYGNVTTENGDIPADEPVIVFRGRDIHVPAVLDAYLALCTEGGSPARHLKLVADTRRQIAAWQNMNAARVRDPDSERSRAWMTE